MLKNSRLCASRSFSLFFFALTALFARDVAVAAGEPAAASPRWIRDESICEAFLTVHRPDPTLSAVAFATVATVATVEDAIGVLREFRVKALNRPVVASSRAPVMGPRDVFGANSGAEVAARIRFLEELWNGSKSGQAPPDTVFAASVSTGEEQILAHLDQVDRIAAEYQDLSNQHFGDATLLETLALVPVGTFITGMIPWTLMQGNLDFLAGVSYVAILQSDFIGMPVRVFSHNDFLHRKKASLLRRMASGEADPVKHPYFYDSKTTMLPAWLVKQLWAQGSASSTKLGAARMKASFTGPIQEYLEPRIAAKQGKDPPLSFVYTDRLLMTDPGDGQRKLVEVVIFSNQKLKSQVKEGAASPAFSWQRALIRTGS